MKKKALELGSWFLDLFRPGSVTSATAATTSAKLTSCQWTLMFLGLVILVLVLSLVSARRSYKALASLQARALLESTSTVKGNPCTTNEVASKKGVPTSEYVKNSKSGDLALGRGGLKENKLTPAPTPIPAPALASTPVPETAKAPAQTTEVGKVMESRVTELESEKNELRREVERLKTASTKVTTITEEVEVAGKKMVNIPNINGMTIKVAGLSLGATIPLKEIKEKPLKVTYTKKATLSVEIFDGEGKLVYPTTTGGTINWVTFEGDVAWEWVYTGKEMVKREKVR